MKTLKYLFFFLTTVLITQSCGDISSEVWIDKSGATKYHVTMNMGEMMQMFETTMDGMDQSTEGTESGDEPHQEQDGMEKMFSDLSKENIVDTTMRITEVMPDSVKALITDTRLLDKFGINIKGNKEKKELFLTFMFEYDSAEQLDSIFTLMESLKNPSDGQEMDSSKVNQLKSQMVDYHLNLEKGELVVEPQLLSEFDDMPSFDIDTMGVEERAMMDMLFGGEISITYHLPGKVISVSDDFVQIMDDRTVRITDSLIQMMKNKASKGYTVKFEVPK